jgi:hypothetical protein
MMSSVTLKRMSRSSTPGDRQPLREPPFINCERVTLNNLWSDAVPFICLAAVLGIIVFLVSWI